MPDLYFQCHRLISADEDDWAKMMTMPFGWMGPLSVRNEKEALSHMLEVLESQLPTFKAVNAFKQANPKPRDPRTELLLEYISMEKQAFTR